VQTDYLCTAEYMWHATPNQNSQFQGSHKSRAFASARSTTFPMSSCNKMLVLSGSLQEKATLTFELFGRRPRSQRCLGWWDARPQR
jgi:hypothetical protein